jgi:hypothetical protein
MAITKIYMKPGPDGGDVLYVESGGTIDIPALSAIVVDGTALTVTATDIEKLASSGDVIASGTQVAAQTDPTVTIADITDSASGAEIATAVNALIDAAEAAASAAGVAYAAFRGFSIMAESE